MAIVSDGEIMAAVDAVLEDPQVNAFRFARGHTLDVAASVAGHMTALTVLANSETEATSRQTTVRTAVIMAVPSAT